MNLDSKALPLVAGLVVLGAAVLLIVGKDFFEPATATPPTPESNMPMALSSGITSPIGFHICF